MKPEIRAEILKRHGGLETATDAELIQFWGSLPPTVRAEYEAAATKAKPDRQATKRGAS